MLLAVTGGTTQYPSKVTTNGESQDTEYVIFGLGYGFTDWMDGDIRYGIPATIAGTIRFGFFDQRRFMKTDWPFCAAIGGSLSYWVISSGSAAIQTNDKTGRDIGFPLYLSQDLSQIFTLYITPRLVYRTVFQTEQNHAGSSQSMHINYLMDGLGVGFMINFGKNKKEHFAIEANRVQAKENRNYYIEEEGMGFIFDF
jgi:hypothetical protein